MLLIMFKYYGELNLLVKEIFLKTSICVFKFVLSLIMQLHIFLWKDTKCLEILNNLQVLATVTLILNDKIAKPCNYLIIYDFAI